MKTWDENRDTINQFWPTQWNAEESKLMKDDLEPLDQVMLYDAIRNVKRSHDTPFVHLKWILDQYSSLSLARKHAEKSPKAPILGGEKLKITVNPEREGELVTDFLSCVDSADPKGFEQIEHNVLSKLGEMSNLAANKVLAYARARLLGQHTQFSQVTADGELKPITFSKLK